MGFESPFAHERKRSSSVEFWIGTTRRGNQAPNVHGESALIRALLAELLRAVATINAVDSAVALHGGRALQRDSIHSYFFEER